MTQEPRESGPDVLLRTMVEALFGSLIRYSDLTPKERKRVDRATDHQLGALAMAGITFDRAWMPISTEARPPAGKPHELAGVYESKDGLLWAFRATHWRPKP